MDAAGWDDRYREAEELVWTQGPNVFVAEILGDRPPGRALDIAAGEGRHSIWLARLGWHVTAVDFSEVGLQRANQWAAAEGVADHLTTVVADVVEFAPAPDSFDLALFAYLQVPEEARRAALHHAAEAVSVGGLIVVVAHDSSNLAHGVGGPPDPAVLYSPTDLAADFETAPGTWTVELAEVRERQVAGAPRAALDAVVVARREA